jgi:hypothetical protein
MANSAPIDGDKRAIENATRGIIWLCSPQSLQHVLDRAFGLRELLSITGAQHHIRFGPAVRIEERMAADRDLGIGLGDLAEQQADVAFARIRAHGFREHANAGFELRRHLIKHRLHNRGHSRHHDYIADPEAGRPRHLVEDEIRALGDARHAQARLIHLGAGRLQPFVQDGDRAWIGVDRHTERLRRNRR